MKYKYQMHMHTFACSACALSNAQEYAKALFEGGFAGGVITNHFYHGNTRIERSLPWKKFVKAYEKDYLEFKKAGKKYGLDIFFGIEHAVGVGKEILCYGITPQFLYEHPELIERDIEIWHKTLHQNGALCVQAHPFRERDYIKSSGMLPLTFLDGLEVFNAANTPEQNLKAQEFAKQHPELILISGGDAHHFERACQGGIETAERIKNEKDLANILKTGKYDLIYNNN